MEGADRCDLRVHVVCKITVQLPSALNSAAQFLKIYLFDYGRLRVRLLGVSEMAQVGAAAGSTLELVVWLLGIDEAAVHPSRQVVVVDA